MDDPKDKLVLFKEILSLMIVTLGFITALISSGILKNFTIDPFTFLILAVIIFFIIQLIVRFTFGEEKYSEIKKKTIATIRDFAIVLMIIVGCYFGGKYASGNLNASLISEKSGAIKETAGEKSLSATPLKNLKKEKNEQSLKSKEKASSKDVKKSEPKEREEAQSKHNREESASKINKSNEEKNSPNAKSAHNAKNGEIKKPVKTEDSAETEPLKSKEKAVANARPNTQNQEEKQTNKTDEKTGSVNANAAIITEDPKIKTGENNAASKTDETALTSIKKTDEVKISTQSLPDQKTSSVETAIVPKAVSENSKNEKKTSNGTESVVINVVSEDEAEVPVKTEIKIENKAEELPEGNSANAKTDEVKTYKLKTEKQDDELLKPGSTSVDFEQTAPDAREKTNDDKIIVKKEYEINEGSNGLKKVGGKVVEGGKKIIDGGTNLFERAGSGIKKQFNKIVK